MCDEKFLEKEGWYFYAKLRDGSSLYQQEIDENSFRYALMSPTKGFIRISQAKVKELVNIPHKKGVAYTQVQVFPYNQIIGNDGDVKPLKYGNKAFKER